MSQFYFHQPIAAEPKSNSALSGQTIGFGSFQGGFDANLNQGTAGVATSKTQTFFAGLDDATHDSDSIEWITPPLAAGSSGTGAFKIDVWLDASAVPLSGIIKLKATLFKWLANDTNGAQIGTTATTVDITTTVTQYTLTFSASTSTTNSDGDRYIADTYWSTKDAVSLGDSGIYTFRIRYDSSSRPSSLTMAGTQTQYVYNRILPSAGAGI